MTTIRKFHKWLGLAIGLQVIIWVTSGMIISLLDQNLVSGSSTKQALTAKHPIGAPTGLISIERLGLPETEQVSSITLRRLGSQPDSQLVYQITGGAGVEVFDAHSGEVVKITKQAAEQKAVVSYKGDGKLASSAFLAEGSNELPNANSVWRINFDDGLATRVYVSGLDGAVLAHRNQYWKVVDFLLMLHFMDYAREDNFNNIQIMLVGFAAFLLATFGLLLVKKGFTRRDFTWRGLTR